MKCSTTQERLKQIMNERSLKQVDILNKCKPFCEKYNVRLGRNDLSQYLSGKVIPSQRKLTVLALALDVEETWLMGYDVPKTYEEKQLQEQYLQHAINQEENEIFRIFMKLGYEQYRMVYAYYKLSSEGRDELMNVVNYIITKYGLQNEILSKSELDDFILNDILNGGTYG